MVSTAVCDDKIRQCHWGHVAPGTLDPLEGQRACGHEERLGGHLPHTDTEQQAGERRGEDSDSRRSCAAGYAVALLIWHR